MYFITFVTTDKKILEIGFRILST